MFFSICDISLNFENINEYSIITSIVGYVIVFTALVTLYYVFHFLPKILHIKIRKRLRKEGKACAELDDLSVTGEVNAAIATALHLYFEELHDRESNIITVHRVSKTYSPWSSKIYGLRNFPRNR